MNFNMQTFTKIFHLRMQQEQLIEFQAFTTHDICLNALISLLFQVAFVHIDRQMILTIHNHVITRYAYTDLNITRFYLSLNNDRMVPMNLCSGASKAGFKVCDRSMGSLEVALDSRVYWF